MPEVEVKCESTAEFFAAAIDMKKLRFVNGAATRKLGDGPHALQWFVRGSPGASYSIQITSPRAARFAHAATLDRDMKDAGVHWFALGAGG
jgi:hypothetical protein